MKEKYMKRTFAEALEHRRSYYSIGSDSPVFGRGGGAYCPYGSEERAVGF